jgi:Domain of unknown function (DUF5914)/Rieske [2Fe-2S] domain
MSVRTVVASRWAKSNPFTLLPRTDWTAQKATHRDAVPAVIEAARKRSAARPSGNWFSFAASDAVGHRSPFGTTVARNEIVAWRSTDGTLQVGPGSCPHLGAELSTGSLDCGTLICPWHGMRLSGRRQLGWTPYPAYDDGVLAWVRLDHVGGEKPTASPVLPDRPHGAVLHAVTRLVGTCEVADIIANRLDPWHGAWFHPHSFARLDVLSAPPVDPTAPADADRFLVAVTFHVGRVGIPVIAEFTSPERRTIVMRIVDGEGTGSVVETHATPLGPGSDGRPRTAVLEAVIAHSGRPGFVHALRGEAVIKPFMRHAATRLWRDDLAYAERRYAVRTLPGHYS